jgi:hypothetical protein
VTLRPAIKAHADVVLAGLVGALYVVEIASESRFAGDRAVSICLALLFSATLAAARSAPLLGLLAGVGMIVLSNEAGPPLADTAAFLLGFAVAIYSTGRYARGRAATAGGLIVAVALPLAVIEPGQPFNLAEAAFIAIFFAGPFAAGRVIRHRQEREHGLEARAAALELERDASRSPARPATAARRSPRRSGSPPTSC